MKAYLEISVEKELPKGESAIWMQPIGDKLKRFRELFLPELMEEFETKRAGYLNQGHSIKSALNEFYKEKGIL